jgi:hypothetical protein
VFFNRTVPRVALAAGLLATGLLPAWAARTWSPRADRAEGLRLVRRDFSRGDRTGAIGLEVDRHVYGEMLRKQRVVIEDFPLPGKVPVDLELTPFEVLAPDARIVVVDGHGERDLPRPAFQAYRGSVVGDPDSAVTLVLFEHRIAGSVRTWDDEFVIAPRRFNLARRGARQIRVWRRDDDPDRPSTPQCAAEPGPAHEPASLLADLAPRGGTSAPPAPADVDGDTLLLAEVAVDATYEWFAHFGSVPAAESYILNLLAQVSTIYENEVRVQLQVPYLRIFTTPDDPYTDGATDTEVLLDDLRTEWNTHQTAIDRTVVHLFSVRPSGGSGLAYVDVLCDHAFRPGSSADYAVSTLSANGGSWEKNLVAHELGHNFSSPHTHCYVPEIDQCANQAGCYSGPIVDTPSTIMSYCSQVDSSFHARVEDEKIRPAAEAAFPICIGTAGLPGRLDDGGGVALAKPNQCPAASLSGDDGWLNQYYGYTGTAQMAWIKRFSPACQPFLLERIDVLIGHASSVAVGRPIRLLVYHDPGGSGDPDGATLVYTEDVAVQVVSNSVFNQYTLATPVTLTSGDFYLGVYDLEDDEITNYIATLDSSSEGDSYQTANSTSPQDFHLHEGGTWMIRGAGGPVGAGGLLLQWGAPCNDATTPRQDFAVYRGAVGDYTSYSSVTCSTGRDTSYLAVDAPEGSFFLVVPRTSANEGSYGLTGAGAERPAAAAPCRPQSVGACP